MWFVYALGSAVFAALTSILAKIGIEGVNSTLATAIREITREVVRTMAEDQRRAHPHCSDETLTLPDLVGWDDLDGSSN